MSERSVSAQAKLGGIRRDILGFSLMLVLLLAFLFAGLGGLLVSRALSQRIQSQMEAVAAVRESEIQRWADERRRDLAILSTESALQQQWMTFLTTADDDPAHQAAYSDIAVRLTDFLRKKVAFVDLSLLHSETGQILISTDVLREGEYHASEAFFLEGREGVYVETMALDPLLNTPTLIVARPVRSSEGRVVAVLVGRANLADLGGVLAGEIGFEGRSKTYLLSREGRYLAGSVEPGSVGEMSTIYWLRRDASPEGGGTAFYINHEGQEVIGTYRWLPSLQAGLLIEVPRAVERRVVMTQFVSMGAVMLLGSGIAIALAVVLIRRIVGPIEMVTAAVTEITAGNLERRVPVEREDEVGVLAQAFNAMTDRLQNLIGTLEQRIAERTRDAERRAHRIQTASELSATIAALRDLDTLLVEVTRRVSERFGFYHVGVFLMGESDEVAVLRAANSPGGRRMLRRGHKLRAGEGIVGYVITHLEPRIALDVGEDAVFFDNPDLPETRSEMALPLLVGDNLVGVLDVQSKEGGAFSEEDVVVLQGLAGQLAVSIENARLFAESERALAAMRRAYGEVSRAAWEHVLRSRRGLRYRSTSEGLEAVRGELLEEGLSPETRVDGAELVVPLKVRDQVIGGFRVVRSDEDGGWTEAEVDLIETLTEQLSVALESARLYEDTQRRAAQERMLGEMAARFTESLDLDALLRVAVQELGELPNVVEASVQVGGWTDRAAPDRPAASSSAEENV